jgi:hypothetical protein
MKEVYWITPLTVIDPTDALLNGIPIGTIVDDFDEPYEDVMIDGKTKMGPWANMTPKSWTTYGIGRLGQGYGQKYEKQKDGRWLKVEG